MAALGAFTHKHTPSTKQSRHATRLLQQGCRRVWGNKNTAADRRSPLLLYLSPSTPQTRSCARPPTGRGPSCCTRGWTANQTEANNEEVSTLGHSTPPQADVALRSTCCAVGVHPQPDMHQAHTQTHKCNPWSKKARVHLLPMRKKAQAARGRSGLHEEICVSSGRYAVGAGADTPEHPHTTAVVSGSDRKEAPLQQCHRQQAGGSVHSTA